MEKLALIISFILIVRTSECCDLIISREVAIFDRAFDLLCQYKKKCMSAIKCHQTIKIISFTCCT